MPNVIGIDCDEVLCGTMDRLLQMPFFVEKGITRQDVTSYELRQIPKLGMTAQTAMETFYEFFHSDAFREAQPVSGALEKLQQWKSQGHTLIVVTGRSEALQEKTKQWISQHFPDIFDDFLFANCAVADEVPKSQLCKQAGIELMVEDDLDFVKDLVEHSIPCFLLDKPWNQGYSPEKYPGVIKVSSWADIDLSVVD